MPYRVRGRWVQVKRGKAWRNLKKHKSTSAAKKHAAALNIHVAHRKRRS